MIRLLLTATAAVALFAAPVAANAATKAVTKTTTTTTTKMKPTHTAMHAPMRGAKHTPMRARPSDSPGTDALNDQALAAARGTGPAPVPAK